MATRKADSIKEVPGEFIACRSFRHSNKKHITDHITTDNRGRLLHVVRETICLDCDTHIEQTIEVPSMRVVKSKYIYPDYYSVRGGVSILESRRHYFRQLGYKLPREQAQ